MSRGHTLVLSASNRSGSHSAALADRVREKIEAAGLSTVFLDLVDFGLPFHDPVDHHAPESSRHQQVRELAALAADAHSFVWVTPIYHGTFSGMLKNALDNLNIPLVSGKPVFMLANGGGRFGGAVFDHMRTMVVNLHAVPVTCQVLSLRNDFAEMDAPGFTLADPQIDARIDRGVNELVGYVSVFAGRGEVAQA